MRCLGAGELRDAEIEELHGRLAVDVDEEDVVGLEIAVHDALRVCRHQRAGERTRDPSDLWRDIPARAIRVRSDLFLSHLHHEVVATVGERPEREDVDDVRIADLIDHARLVDEALDREWNGRAPGAAP